jgi:hypothetical protein
MTSKSYSLLGWLVWQIASRVAKRKIGQNRNKIGAVVIVGGVLVAGLLAARAGDDS